MTDTTPTPEQGDDNDPLADAEAIVNEAAANMGDEANEASQAEDGAETNEQGEASEVDAIIRAEQVAAEHLADLQRLQAEYVNYRKRVDRDRETAGELAIVKVVEALIPALDDIAGAREHGDLEDGPFKAIASKIEDTLGKFGWASFGAVGEEFDPQHHEALMSQSSADVEVPTIQHVAQPGHRVGDRVVRAARVVVAQPE